MKRQFLAAAFFGLIILSAGCGGDGGDGESGQPQLGSPAYGTLVAVPGGFMKEMETLDVGDQVLAGTRRVTPGNEVELTWIPAPVVFSAGTGAQGLQPIMVYVVYGDSPQDEIIVSPSHLFLLSNGSLTAADKLLPGDLLLRADGTSAEVRSLTLGQYSKGIHNIGVTSLRQPVSFDGHLITTNGVVSADYVVEVYYDHHSARILLE